MQKVARYFLFSLFGVGNILLLAVRKFKSGFSDFWIGFIEGLAVTFIIFGAGYLLYCAITKTHPYKITDNHMPI